MGLFKKAKNAIKSTNNVKKMVGFDQIKNDSKIISDSFNDLWRTQKSSEIHNETFDQALKRLNLTEADLNNRKNKTALLMKLYAGIGGLLLVYLIYLLFAGHLAAAFTTLMLVMIAGLFAVRESFWLCQMQKRKLGVKFNEWFAWLVKRGRV